MKQAFALGLLAAAAALPLSAGTIYVPFATDEVVGSARYRTEIAVTNPGDAPARFATVFVGADGVRHPARVARVAAHGTAVLAAAVPAGQRGRVEVSGPAALAVSARLNAFDGDGRLLSSAVEPAVSAASLVPAGQTIHLQGLVNTADAVSRLGVVTAGDLGACSLSAFSTDGVELGVTSRVAPRVMSRDFAEPLQALRSGAVEEARLEVTCDAPAYAYAATLSRDGSRTGFVGPSTRLAADLTSISAGVAGAAAGGDGPAVGGKPGGEPASPGATPTPPSPDPPGDPVALDQNGSFKIDGTFFSPVDGDSYRQYVLDLKQGTKYHRIIVDFDVFINRWQTSIFQAVAGMRRADRTLYWGLLIRVDKQKTLIDAGHDRLYKGVAKWAQKSNYHVTMNYDTAARKITLQIFDGDGNLFQTISGKTTNNDLRKTKAVYIDFGLRGVADHAYFPPSTWQYSNLRVIADP